MQAGHVVETSNGWLLDIIRVDWWDDRDGAVWGKMLHPAKGEWSPEKYIGTVKGISQAAVGVKFGKPT